MSLLVTGDWGPVGHESGRSLEVNHAGREPTPGN